MFWKLPWPPEASTENLCLRPSRPNPSNPNPMKSDKQSGHYCCNTCLRILIQKPNEERVYDDTANGGSGTERLFLGQRRGSRLRLQPPLSPQSATMNDRQILSWTVGKMH